MEYKSLPSVYQLDVCSVCDLRCPMCLRTIQGLAGSVMPIELVELMIERGDLRGTYFTELQMAGEPTLNRDLFKIASLLSKAGILIGLSTHGHRLAKTVFDSTVTVAERLCESFDALTVSVDSVDEQVYQSMRLPKTFAELESNLSHLYRCWQQCPRPLIDLQVVATPIVPGSGKLDDLRQYIQAQGWQDAFHARAVGDSFLEMGSTARPIASQRKSTMCLNPWMSVSVRPDGDVVSCCYVFDSADDSPNVYGNLRKNSLFEIWSSPKIDRLRQWFTSPTFLEPGPVCERCYQTSPVLLHEDIVCRILRYRREKDYG